MPANSPSTTEQFAASQESERFLGVIENFPCALWEVETDSEGHAKRFVFLSNSAERLFGHPHEFLLEPANWGKIVYDDDKELFIRQMAMPFSTDGRKIYHYRITTHDGRVIPIEATVALVRNEEGVPVAQRGVTLDISEPYRSMEHWKMLAKTGETLGESLDLKTTLSRITQALVPICADICAIQLNEGAGILSMRSIAASTAELEAMVQESSQRFPARPEMREMIMRVLESKLSYVIEMTDEFRRAHSTSEEHYEFQKRIDIRSVIITPLFVEDELLGVILLSTVGSRAAFTEEDRLFVEELARQASFAIHNARLLSQARAEAEARSQLQGRLELLSHVSVTLAGAIDPELALAELAKEFVPRLADCCLIVRSNPSDVDEINARVIGMASEPSELVQLLLEAERRFPAPPDAPFGLKHVLRTQTPEIHLEYNEDLLRSMTWSEDHLALFRMMRVTSSLMYPLIAHDEVYGAIFFAHSEQSSRHFVNGDISLVEEIVRRVSFAIYKANMFNAAQAELDRRIRLQQRMELLEEIGQRVAGSLKVQDLLKSVAPVIAPAFADWITVDLITNSVVDRAFIYHSDSMLQTAAEGYRKQYGQELSRAVLEMLRRGDPIFIPVPTEERRETFGLTPERWERVQELGANSLIMVPLRSRRRTLGILGFDYGHSGRQYTSEDVEFAVEIASRIASGVDNALLLEEATLEIQRRTELQRRLEEAKEAAELANRTKDQFIAMLSHELRTPLTPVLATCELLKEDDDFPEPMLPYLELIRRNIEIEARLIDDLLDMTRVVKGKLRFVETDVDLHAVIPEVIEICRQDFDRASLRLVTKLHATNTFVRGDRDRLSQVLWNLLHNATKFTPEGGVITVRTRNDSAGGILIEVQDTGYGIEPSELARIFEPFEQRAELRGGMYGGLGLGLAISRSIVEMHGGTIEARSVGEGHGATFIIRFAVTQLALPERAPLRTNGTTIPKRSGRILMVDDHIDTNAALKILLERRGYQVTTAGSVARGLELARMHAFDVLVSDIGLPDGDGIDLLRAIRSDGTVPGSLRAIAVSGYGTEADIERSLSAGFEFHLKKPIAFPDLQRALDEVLSATEQV